MGRIILFVIVLTFQVIGITSQAQETATDTLKSQVSAIRSELNILKRIKTTGYIQVQYQVADSAGAKGYAGGDFANGVDKRFMARRGRIKFQYDSPSNKKGWSTSQYVLQFDVTERGLTIKDAKVKAIDPWVGWFSVTAGMQDRPFGFEIGYSSSMRESPERGRMSQILFPNERDLGAMLTVQGPKKSDWNWLKLDAGFFNGTGAPSFGANASDFDKFKDLIAHLSATKSSKNEKVKWGIGVSLYDGGFRLDGQEYEMGVDASGINGFIIKTTKADISSNINVRGQTKRQYAGADGQLNVDWAAGITTLRAEYIQGSQPATSGNSTSPATMPVSTSSVNNILQDTSGKIIIVPTSSTGPADIYNRNFNGAYFYFIHSIKGIPLQAIVKYDWYDPNTDVQGNDIGLKTAGTVKATSATDIKYTTLGLGLAYFWDANLKVTAYYDIVQNEKSNNLSGYHKDILDNVFTLRMQAKF